MTYGGGGGGGGNHYGITVVTGAAEPARCKTPSVHNFHPALLCPGVCQDGRDNAWSDLSGEIYMYRQPGPQCQYNEPNFHTIAAFKLQNEQKSFETPSK